MIDPDRLLPVDSRTRDVARSLYALTAELPILSPHGHVDAALLYADRAFADPAELFITHDHYVTRLLLASGVDVRAHLDRGDARAAWSALADHWHVFSGTAVAYWLEAQLDEFFGVTATDATAFDAITRRLSDLDMRPRALLDRFRVEVLATTDHPLDDLAAHRALAADPTGTTRVVPTFRPDSLIDPRHPQFLSDLERLTQGAGLDDFSAYLTALEARREYFISCGAVSADHGVEHPRTLDLEASDAAALFRSVVAGGATEADLDDFAAHMLLQMARMSVADGLVMTVHAGVLRNHSTPAFDRFGADSGHDIPVATEFTRNLRPLLERFGHEPNFHLVLFTLDESTWSRELAPLASVYPSVYVGAPWWFLDAPDAALRFRSAVTETAGFTRGSGFIDDTRALLSIPARHDMARRVDASYLASLVVQGRLGRSDAERIAVDLVTRLPREVFKL